MKHNNVIPNGHFKKHWQNYVKTWFNQPARKARRRTGNHFVFSCLHSFLLDWFDKSVHIIIYSTPFFRLVSYTWRLPCMFRFQHDKKKLLRSSPDPPPDHFVLLSVGRHWSTTWKSELVEDSLLRNLRWIDSIDNNMIYIYFLSDQDLSVYLF